MNAKYLVVGGGMTADAAVKALRRSDPSGSVLLVGREAHAPYKRPPLSKGLWWEDPPPRTDLATADSGASLLLGVAVERLDVPGRAAHLSDGRVVRFEKALLATGASARNLPVLAGLQNVYAYRTFADFQAVQSAVAPGTRVVVVGGGFIGSEMAAALTRRGAQVTMVFPEASIGGGRFPASIAAVVDADYRERGVELKSGSSVTAARNEGQAVVLTLDDGSVLAADLVVVGVGAVPNDELAAAAGLRTGNGVAVDSRLRVLDAAGQAVEHVLAAGDVASFEWPALGRRLRIEHEDNAYSMGSYAGKAMATAEVGTPYDHLPFFYSDLFDNGYEAVGLLDPRLTVVEDWRQPGKEGVVYYLEDGRVRGVLLWNTWGQVDAARDLISHPGPHAPEDLIGRLPEDD